MMLSSWNSQGGKSESIRIGRAVSDFNRDDNYISNVYSVMEIIAKRTDRSFASEFDGLDYYEFSYGTPISSEISQNTQKPNIQKLRLLIRARKK